ncbi:hypothetical protein UACE39S_03815 [Ureibacillus acetophenoni]
MAKCPITSSFETFQNKFSDQMSRTLVQSPQSLKIVKTTRENGWFVLRLKAFVTPAPKGALNSSPTALLFRLTLKGFHISSSVFLSFLVRKRINKLFHTELFCDYIILYLIANVFFYYLFISSYCINIKASTPKFSVTYLYFKFACRSNIIKLLLPFKYPTNEETLIFGGILTNICMWSLHAVASIISTPFLSHNCLRICPMSFLYFPINNLSSIFWCEYYVILTIPCCMC